MHKAVSRLFLIPFSLVLALLAGEIALRVAGFRAPQILPADVRHQYSREPHAQFLYRGYLPGTFEDFENPVKLNNWGFHDREYETNRPTPQTFRLLVIGDSYVASLSTPLDGIFHKIMEKRLQAEDPFKRGSYQVIAFGQGRSAQQTELEWLRKFGPMYHPDAVLLMFFCGNDVMENSEKLMGAATEFGSKYVTDILPRKQAHFEKLLLLPHSRLNGAIAEYLTTRYTENLYAHIPGAKKEDFISPELGVYHKPLAPDWLAAFSETDRLLREIKSECEKEHAPLLVGCLEGPQAIGEASTHVLWADDDPAVDFEQPDTWLAGWCATNKVPLCELEPSLVEAGRTRVFWRHDGHLNVYGNKTVAQPLYQFIIKECGQTGGKGT